MGRDPEICYTQKGDPVATLAVATQYDDKTTWVKVTVFGKTAEVVGQYTKKGSKIGVSGWLQEERWTDKDGNKRSTLGVVANHIQFLDKKEKDDVPI